VKFDSLGNSTANNTRIRTSSSLTRWSIVPNSKISFYPELQWSSSERSNDGGEFLPEKKELAPRAIFYTNRLIPGITTYYDGEINYSQSGFNADNKRRDVELNQQSTAQIDLAPGAYVSLLNPVSLRFNLVRNADDSLHQIGEEYSLFDLGFDWRDYPANVHSYRYDSDAVQITWVPHYSWLLYQSVSETRSSSTATQQFYSSRIEWKPTSRDQIFLKYSLQRTLISQGEYIHKPGIEWYRRWSGRTFTRAQIYTSFTDASSSDRRELIPGIYLDQKLILPGIPGTGTWRLDLSSTYSKQAIPIPEDKIIIGGYSRIDWSFWQKFLFRFRIDRDNEYSFIDGTSYWSWGMEFRGSVRF